MVAIVIRHANDRERRAVHRHDKEITRDGEIQAKKIGKKLIKKYGDPDIIYCSPMMRTKQTLKKMLKHVESEPRIIIENRLSRYFNHRERDEPSLFTMTGKDIPLNETHRAFKKRCDLFLKDIKNSDKNHQVVWIITHALVLKRFCKKLKISRPRHVDFLDYHRL